MSRELGLIRMTEDVKRAYDDAGKLHQWFHAKAPLLKFRPQKAASRPPCAYRRPIISVSFSLTCKKR
jgi:hypothetical protein